MTHASIYRTETGRWRIRWHGETETAEAGVDYATAEEAKEEVMACAPVSALNGTLLVEIEGETQAH